MRYALLLIAVFSFSGFGQTANSPVKTPTIAQRLQAQKVTLEANRAELLKRYTPDYVKVREIDAELARVDAEIAKLVPIVPAVKLSPAALATLGEVRLLREAVRSCGSLPTFDACKSGDFKERLAVAYTKAVLYDDVMTILIGDAIENFDTRRELARSADQVSQLADEQNADLMRLIVVQNQRIIQLLEQIAKKK